MQHWNGLNRRKRGVAKAGGTLAALLMLAAGSRAYAAVSPACQPLLDAAEKQLSTPSHLFMTRAAQFQGGKPTTSESIFTQDQMYVRVNGAPWRRNPVKVADLRKMQKDQEGKTKLTCRYLRDETVNGEAAAVYSQRAEPAEAKIDSTIWISKSRNLPLKLESDLDVGGTKGKSHTSIRYEYGNIQPPAGVK